MRLPQRDPRRQRVEAGQPERRRRGCPGWFYSDCVCGVARSRTAPPAGSPTGPANSTTSGSRTRCSRASRARTTGQPLTPVRAVVVEEDLLQARLLDGDVERGRAPPARAAAARARPRWASTHASPARSTTSAPGSVRRAGPPAAARRARAARAPPQVLDGALVDDAAGADQRHPLAQPLHLGQHVRGQEDGAPGVAAPAQQREEALLHQRVEALAGLVQDQQLGVVLERLRRSPPSGACRASSRAPAGPRSAAARASASSASRAQHRRVPPRRAKWSSTSRARHAPVQARDRSAGSPVARAAAARRATDRRRAAAPRRRRRAAARPGCASSWTCPRRSGRGSRRSSRRARGGRRRRARRAARSACAAPRSRWGRPPGLARYRGSATLRPVRPSRIGAALRRRRRRDIKERAAMAVGSTVDVVMPQMGVSVSEGTVSRWLKAVGDRVEADETIVEISTDKVDTEVPVAGLRHRRRDPRPRGRDGPRRDPPRRHPDRRRPARPQPADDARRARPPPEAATPRSSPPPTAEPAAERADAAPAAARRRTRQRRTHGDGDESMRTVMSPVVARMVGRARPRHRRRSPAPAAAAASPSATSRRTSARPRRHAAPADAVRARVGTGRRAAGAERRAGRARARAPPSRRWCRSGPLEEIYRFSTIRKVIAKHMTRVARRRTRTSRRSSRST